MSFTMVDDPQHSIEESPTLLNNSAIELLHQQKFALALDTFRHALTIISNNSERNPPNKDDTGVTFLDFPVLESVPFTGCGIMVNSPESFCLDSYLSCYGCAFSIHAGLDKTVQLSDTAAILYNMGITFHYYGIYTGHLAKLRKASKLYNMSLRVLQDTELSLQGNRNDIILLKVALLNNSGHISSIFYSKEETQWYVQQMGATLCSLPSNGPSLIQTHFECFNESISAVSAMIGCIMDCSPAA
jgi:tetratricopeptide (TPR) repeat protein